MPIFLLRKNALLFFYPVINWKHALEAFCTRSPATRLNPWAAAAPVVRTSTTSPFALRRSPVGQNAVPPQSKCLEKKDRNKGIEAPIVMREANNTEKESKGIECSRGRRMNVCVRARPGGLHRRFSPSPRLQLTPLPRWERQLWFPKHWKSAKSVSAKSTHTTSMCYGDSKNAWTGLHALLLICRHMLSSCLNFATELFKKTRKVTT